MVQEDNYPDSRLGIVAGLAAYGLWGLMPLYFAALRHVPAYEILAQRIVWCGVLLTVAVSLAGRLPDLLRGFRTPRVVGTFLLTAFFLSINWLTYIHGVVTRQTLETSLGYFINPLLNVALGMLVFGERLRPMQMCAVVLAVLGVLNLVVAEGHFPWIALSLATSFALYGIFRKTAPADALLGLTMETLLLFVPACVYAGYLATVGDLHLNASNWGTDGLLVASGIVTAVPLLCFGVAAHRLRLSTLGFLQYLAPCCQFLLAITVLGEEMRRDQWYSFACIWLALGIYSLDIWRGLRRSRPEATDQSNKLIRVIEIRPPKQTSTSRPGSR